MRKLSNNASSVLDAALPVHSGPGPFVDDLHLPVGELDQFPDVQTDDWDYAYCTVQAADGHYEIVLLTALDPETGVGKITRGNGAFPVGHLDAPPDELLAYPVGSRFELRVTAGLFADFIQRNGDSVNGGVFGESPDPPPASVRIITKHSTGDTPPEVADLTRGEVAVNVKLRKVYVGSVDDADAPTVVELVPGFHWAGPEPADEFKTLGTMWFDATNYINTLKIWSGPDASAGAWAPCIDLALLQTDIILMNDKAIQGRNVANTEIFNLIKVNPANEGEFGDIDLPLIKFVSPTVQFSPHLKIKATATAHGTWDFFATAVSGIPRMVISPAMPAATPAWLALTALDDDGTVRTFLCTQEGQFRIPAAVPTNGADAVRLDYLEARLANVVLGVAAPIAAGRFAKDSTGVGTFIGCTGAIIGFDQRRVTLTPVVAATVGSANDLAVTIGIEGNPSLGECGFVLYRVASASVIDFFTALSGTSGPAVGQMAFSFVIYDRGA